MGGKKEKKENISFVHFRFDLLFPPDCTTREIPPGFFFLFDFLFCYWLLFFTTRYSLFLDYPPALHNYSVAVPNL